MSKRFDSLTPLFITPERLEEFRNLFLNSSNLFAEVKQKYIDLKTELGEEPELNDLSSDPFAVSDESVQNIRNKLFPEKRIDIFYEIDESMLTVDWEDFDISTLSNGLNKILQKISDIEKLEELVRLKKIATEKLRI
jgi:hypothetical protein